MVWYSHNFKNCPQFSVIHRVKDFGVINKAEVDIFLEFSCFFDEPVDVGNLVSGSSDFSKPTLSIWKSMVHVLLKLGLENFERDRNTRPPDLPLEKSVCRSGSKLQLDMGTIDWFQIGKGVRQGCILSPCLSTSYAEYIMRNAGLEETHAGIKIAGEISITSDMQMTPPLWQKVKN